MKDKPFLIVLRSEGSHGIAGHPGRIRDLRQKPAVRPVEPKLAVGLSIDLIALLVDGAMVPPTEQSQIRERGRASPGPVTDVMALREPSPAAREATTAVSVIERPP